MSYHTYLETLIVEEIAHRAQTRLTRAVRKARFPFLRTIDDFNFTFRTALKLQMLGSYLWAELVTEGKNAIFSGPSGTGKSHLRVAIAYRAIQHGDEARFVGADHLIGDLSRAASKGGWTPRSSRICTRSCSSSMSWATSPTPPMQRTYSIASSTTAICSAGRCCSRPTPLESFGARV